MLKDLVSNAAILIAFIFMAGEILRNDKFQRYAKNYIRYFGGILAGFLGIVLMLFGVAAPNDVIIDIRQFALILAAIYGGFFPTLIAGIIMSLFRLIYFGVNHSSILGALLIQLISLACTGILLIKTSENKKWFYMNASSLIIYSVLIVVTLEDNVVLLQTLFYFCLISVLAGYLVVYLSKHINFTNSLFNKYKQESTKDFLTGLNNVRSFDVLINEVIERTVSNEEQLSLLMLDLDHFKKINDTYGHSIGDDVLRELAYVVSGSCRADDIVSRVGGEEFCVILPNCPFNKALEIAERIRMAVENHIFTDNKLRITISIGAVNYPETVHPVHTIIEEADKALYNSKRTGRNKVSVNVFN